MEWFGVQGWGRDKILFERHRYSPGPAAEMVRHAHADYQCCLSLDFPGEYEYRGARHAVPVGSLSILHPGEAHVARDPVDRLVPATWLVAYVPPAAIAGAVADVPERSGNEPFFRDPVLMDSTLSALFARAHRAAQRDVAELEQDVLWADFLSRLAGYARQPVGDQVSSRRARRAVQTVRAHLEEHWAEPVRLSELAELAGLGPHQLNRTFSRTVGVPPHRYQLQLRVDRAKALLVRGVGIAAAAAEAGFVDQSHLTRHFGRFVGIPPSAYDAGKGKNVLDGDVPRA